MTCDLIKEFHEKYPQHSHIKLGVFNSIIQKFNRNIVKAVIDEPNGISLPQRLGAFMIMAFPTSPKKIIDFGASNKAGTTIYASNWDTDNRVCKIVYAKERDVVTNHRFWKFDGGREFTTAVSSAFRTMWPKYTYVVSKQDYNKILRQK